MFTHYRTQGFILKKEDRGEADRLFTVFTRDFGKLSLIAKAERKIKSKLRAGLEIFYLTEIEFIQGKAQKTLTDSILIDNFKNLRKSLKKISLLHKIAEIIDSLVRGEEKDEEIWKLLIEVFEKLDDKEKKQRPLTAEIIYNYFIWNFLSLLGYQPDFYNCVVCQKKAVGPEVYFSKKDGGLVCEKCKSVSSKEIDLNVVKIIRILLQRDWKTLVKLKTEEAQMKLLNYFSRYYLSRILEENK